MKQKEFETILSCNYRTIDSILSCSNSNSSKYLVTSTLLVKVPKLTLSNNYND